MDICFNSMTFDKLQTWAGLFIALGSATTIFTTTLLPAFPHGDLKWLVYVAALGASLSAFGNSIRPRNGAKQRIDDYKTNTLTTNPLPLDIKTTPVTPEKETK